MYRDESDSTWLAMLLFRLDLYVTKLLVNLRPSHLHFIIFPSVIYTFVSIKLLLLFEAFVIYVCVISLDCIFLVIDTSLFHWHLVNMSGHVHNITDPVPRDWFKRKKLVVRRLHKNHSRLIVNHCLLSTTLIPLSFIF